MAINFGARKLLVWLNLGGLNVPSERAEVTLEGQSKTGTWMAEIPLTYPGAFDVAAGLGDTECSVTVSIDGDETVLVTGKPNRIYFDLIHTIIRVEGDDGSGVLHNYKTSQSFKNQTNANVAQSIVGQAGLGFASTVASYMAGRKMQSDYVKMFDGVSYAAALHKLAEADGARWWMDKGTIHYAPQNSGEGSYQLSYQFPTPSAPMRSDCLDLVVKYNVQAGQPQRTTVNTWNTYDKKAYRAVVEIPGIGNVFDHEFNIPALTQDQAQQHAQSKALAFSLNGLELTALVVGDPTLNAAMMIQLSGASALDGQYVIKSIMHEVGWTGYTTLIKATKGTA